MKFATTWQSLAHPYSSESGGRNPRRSQYSRNASTLSRPPFQCR